MVKPLRDILAQHYMTDDQLRRVENTNDKKHVESILRMGENEQSAGALGIWAITMGPPVSYEVAPLGRQQSVHWWTCWVVNEGARENYSSCGGPSQGNVVVGVRLDDALHAETELWRFLCSQCCTNFLESI